MFGIAVAIYRGKDAKRSLYVCPKCKGTVIRSLVAMLPDTPPDAAVRAIASLVTGAFFNRPVTSSTTSITNGDNNNKSEDSWKARGVAKFPALRRYKKTWAELARHIAKGIGLNLGASGGGQSDTAFQSAKREAIAGIALSKRAEQAKQATAATRPDRVLYDDAETRKTARVLELLDELIGLERDLHEAVLAEIEHDKQLSLGGKVNDGAKQGQAVDDAISKWEAAAADARTNRAVATERVMTLRGRVKAAQTELSRTTG
ncbi:uncharacterized protein LY79DRAFT_674148 [Colletotrichum navitas]|uniref:Uncharacterized protein n=1 Tax=Colletotrichum navitas TaxID=681940 RepID=A0AAD8PLY6_9PEZI|nr:uncharacterized protein LY79DRAFT_674148 [Colletotrichum navitas]KAK1570194.1 hypothetical protein LY79DRAFT_674148 [Colletotrichum navitas]